MDYDTTALARLGKRHQQLREALAALIPQLHAEIRAAIAAGVQQIDVAELSGYRRDQIRQITLPAERRRSRRRVAA